jgi:hypothetical protein
MATVSQVQTVDPSIPTALEPYYTGLTSKGEPLTVDGVQQKGLIERGLGAIYSTPQSRQDAQTAYLNQYAPVIQAGLAGSGSVAGLSPFQQQLGTTLGAMSMPGQFNMATEAGQQAASGLQSLQNLQAAGVSAPELTTYQLGPARQFSAAEAQAYMSPYMQAVVDRQQSAAIKAAQQAQLGQNLASARQGTYGGARQALLQGARESGLQGTLADIQARGLQSAYEQAQQQFERDRAAQMGMDTQNLQAALGVQQLGAGQNLAAQQANQQAGLQAAQTRLGASQGLTGLTGQLGQLGVQNLAGQLDIAKAQGAFGDLQRGIEQQRLDAQRQFLTDQAQYGQTQAGALSNLLRGIPLSGATQTVTTPPPSFASQLTGLGLTGIGLYNMLGGGPK